MRKHLLHSLSILAACTASLPLFAQETQESMGGEPPSARVMFGAFGAGTMNIHRGLFNTYDGILECGTFEDTETLGWQAGNVLDLPLAASFGLSTRLYYHKANGDFNAPNPVSPNISLEDGTLVRLNTEHHLKTSLDYVMLDLLGKWNFTQALYLAAGPSVGLSTRAAYEQEEQIITPRGVTFANGQASRTIVAGNFDEQGTQNTERVLRLRQQVPLVLISRCQSVLCSTPRSVIPSASPMSSRHSTGR
jgi:hypothetical protein